MTAPGASITPSPGWWVRPDGIGFNLDSTYGWMSGIAGPNQGLGIGTYGWSSTASGIRTPEVLANLVGEIETSTAEFTLNGVLQKTVTETATVTPALHTNRVMPASRPLTETVTPGLARKTTTAVSKTFTAAITPGLTKISSVTFNSSGMSTGQSGTSSGTPFTFSCSATSGDYVIVMVNGGWTSTITPPTATAVVQFGSTTLTSLGFVLGNNNATGSGFVWVFGGYISTTGSQTVSVTLTQSGALNFQGYASAYSYSNVASVGSLQTAYGHSSSMSMSVSSASGNLVWSGIDVAGNQTVSSSNVTIRQSASSGGGSASFAAGGIAGASTVTPAYSIGTGKDWSLAALNLV